MPAAGALVPITLPHVDQVLAELRTPTDRHVFSAVEGAEAHTQVNNLNRMQEVAFDWLDETLTP